MKWKVNPSSHQHCSTWLLIVRSRSQTSGRALCPPALGDSVQSQTPASVPASTFCGEAETRWAKTQWGEAPSSTWGRTPPSFFSVLPLSRPVHVKSPAAPQGGGWARLWGDLSFPSLFSFFCPCLCPLFVKCMFWSPTRAPRVNADYIWSHDYTFSQRVKSAPKLSSRTKSARAWHELRQAHRQIIGQSGNGWPRSWLLALIYVSK